MAGKETVIETAVDRVFSVGGAAAALALVIVGTLCADYWRAQDESDRTILASTLSVVLGYYFGTKKPAGTFERKSVQQSDSSPN